VLRLMAAVIHELWTRNDQSLMIMSSTIPLDSAPVRNEMLRYLPENWPAVVDVDIDGVESRPFAIDQAVPMLGRYAACRRVARSIFVGSAPSVAAQTVRGVEEVRVRIATAQPGESIAVFGDALKRMSNQLTYLYTDGSRYWYDTRPTVNRLARDRAQHFSADDVNRELITRLKKVGKTRDFAAAHVAPLDTSDVIDDAQARVVLLHPDASHKRTNGDSPAIQMCERLLETRGNAPRLYRNMLVFIAPDQAGAESLREATREYLAWDSIRNDEEQLNLDRQQGRQVRTQLDRANETVDVRLMEAYNWLIVPWQSEPLGDIEMESFRISGSESFYDRAARKLLKDGLLIPAWSPDNLRIEMERVNLWGDNPHISLKQLWEYFGRYCYLPRLLDETVLLGAIKDGISRLDAPFAYATGIEEGRYLGLAFRSASSIYFDDQSLLVQPEAAQAQIDEEQQRKQVPGSPRIYAPPGDETVDDDLESEVVEQRPIATQYYGTVELDAQRINREMGVIVEEVIQRLTSLTGCDVELHLEVRAHRAEGFDEATIRTINENSRTLKFDTHEFD
jgi:hypothetical protein